MTTAEGVWELILHVWWRLSIQFSSNPEKQPLEVNGMHIIYACLSALSKTIASLIWVTLNPKHHLSPLGLITSRVLCVNLRLHFLTASARIPFLDCFKNKHCKLKHIWNCSPCNRQEAKTCTRTMELHPLKKSMGDSQVALVVKSLPVKVGDVVGFDPWVGKIPWRKAWQPTPAFLP